MATNPFPVAIASLPPPQTYLTFFTDTLQANQLQFSFGTSSTKFLPHITAIPLLDTAGKENINLYWNDTVPGVPHGQLYWNYTSANGDILISSAAVQLTSIPLAAQQTSISLPVPISASSTTASGTLPTSAGPTTGVVSTSIPGPTSGTTNRPTATGSTTEPTSIPKLDSGVQPIVVAGIAVGSSIVGALVAGIVAWCCLCRRRKQKRAQDSEPSAIALMHPEKGFNAQVMPIVISSPIPHAMENGLPQPLEDRAIAGEMSKISNSIKNHVQSFYHVGHVSPGVLDLDDLRALGENLPMSTGTLSTLLGNSATREIALRFCIAWVAISRMQLNSLPSMTFLPPEIAECLLSIAADRSPRANSLYLSKWRVITAQLMQSAYVRSPFSAIDARNQNIQAAMNTLEGILQPYADSRVDNNQRRRNLEEILKRAASLAFTLFSQPNSWKFDWQDEESFKLGSLCVFPALVQVTNENGETVKPPRTFSEAVIRRLDE
ncbi:hypothetical protein K504DRAFT_508491 [Pleomassaria siparia CBS 279.74]|uniref:Uncharacterized protein n=1 Tax=Pleomassaria siparia CBS 279.74 TaxID=1314801 RepID=A0A6G1JRZ7_9PLEO|nr:hypothetical protein K504DRAFT_508491 [Pleomassaria siparia CBS 279.74]